MKGLKKEWIFVPAMAMVLNGCAISDGIRTQMEGTGVGAVVGAAVGGLVGGKEGALWGAALGGGLGYIAGSHIASRKQSYANREDALNGEIAYYTKYNRSVAQHNEKLANDVAALQRESNALLAKYKKGKVSRAEIIAKRNAVKKSYAQNEKYLAELNKQYTEGKNYLNSELVGKTNNSRKIAQLRKEQQSLQNKINEAKKLHKQIARVEQGMSV